MGLNGYDQVGIKLKLKLLCLLCSDLLERMDARLCRQSYPVYRTWSSKTTTQNKQRQFPQNKKLYNPTKSPDKSGVHNPHGNFSWHLRLHRYV